MDEFDEITGLKSVGKFVSLNKTAKRYINKQKANYNTHWIKLNACMSWALGTMMYVGSSFF